MDALEGWQRGQFLDAQPLAAGTTQQKRAYGNYVFGVYMEAAGLPLQAILIAANGYATASGAKYDPSTDGPMDPIYTSIPAANVANIADGYNAQLKGTACHP